MSTLFVELISIFVNANMYFNYGFDFIFLILAHDRSWTGEVKH